MASRSSAPWRIACREQFQADFGLAVGPLPPTNETGEAGQVHFALASEAGVETFHASCGIHPDIVADYCAKQAINLARLVLLKTELRRRHVSQCNRHTPCAVICRRHNRLYLALDNGLEFVGVVGDFAGHPRFPQPGHYELGEFVFGFGGEVHLPLPLRADRNGTAAPGRSLGEGGF